ncbi:chemotaxis protein CheX [Phosphitispora fastidiosa]|uniref:chemotaxis protein CheX n=1 Tax=Phosphitispora fastidiosa TaxID=2837202 RepID=UPI001E51485F|nr:chemotaxis protein CheX [Phosphitispora fastidiosa]MBU7005339.1 chemotaxis protein CheX [Phosphitispora fastidiosa]
MKAEFINPFIIATKQVLSQELGKPIGIQIGSLTMQKSSYTALDMTVLIGVTGAVQGIVMFGLSERAVKNFVSGVLGEPVPVIDAMVESAIAEMGNVVTGIASTELEKAGYPCTLAPPTVITGRGVMISTINIQRLQVPLKTDVGDMEISVALRENKK